MKTENTIHCPACNHAFPLEAALTSQLRGKIETDLRATFDARLVEERKTLTSSLTRAAQAEATRLSAVKLAELEAVAAERETAFKRIQVQLDVTRREASLHARDEFVAERKGLEEELGRQRAALADLRKNELELRREKTRLEAARQEFEVQNARTLDSERVRLRDELTRTLDAERVRVRQDLASAHTEAERLRETEHAQQTDALRRQVDDLRRKLDAGGEQRRGEACEVRLEAMLREAFPMDAIEAVARGVNGADVLQRVCLRGAKQSCGTIIYESKHTAAWSAQWTGKLRGDQRAKQADVAVLITAALPKDITTFGLVDGVWVTNVACLRSLALALRLGLLQVASQRIAAINRGEKMEQVYAYATGDQFADYVQSVVYTVQDMTADLQKEKLSHHRTWKRREKQVEEILASVTGLYADFGAITHEDAVPPFDLLDPAGMIENEPATSQPQQQPALL